MESLTVNKLYDLIERTRENSGISYEILSQKMGLSRMGLHKSLKQKSLKLQSLLKLCEILNVDLALIFCNENTENSKELPATIKAKLDLIQKLASEIEQQMYGEV